MKAASARERLGRSRRGITMIEVLIVVTCVSMMLGLCGVSIQLLMRLNGDGVSRYGAAVALERLAQQIRADAHASESGKIDVDQKAEGKPASLWLTFKPDHSVAYQSEGSAVVRTESAAGKLVRHESYALPQSAVARFVLRDEGPSRLVALVVTRLPGKSQTEPPRPLEVVAHIGKDRPRTLGKTGATPR
jgi:Tfp pilus assembly protein PilV